MAGAAGAGGSSQWCTPGSFTPSINRASSGSSQSGSALGSGSASSTRFGAAGSSSSSESKEACVDAATSTSTNPDTSRDNFNNCNTEVGVPASLRVPRVSDALQRRLVEATAAAGGSLLSPVVGPAALDLSRIGTPQAEELELGRPAREGTTPVAYQSESGKKRTRSRSRSDGETDWVVVSNVGAEDGSAIGDRRGVKRKSPEGGGRPGSQPGLGSRQIGNTENEQPVAAAPIRSPRKMRRMRSWSIP